MNSADTFAGAVIYQAMPTVTPDDSTEITLPAPAKVNLMLSVHGARDDGFHELTSMVCAVEFGDSLTVSLREDEDALRCSDKDVPTGEENIILKAAALFRKVSGLDQCFDFALEKRIPMGAGLGGGSSDAATALKAMNALTGNSMELDQLEVISAELGSDCPFFIRAMPAVVRGRGELLDVLDAESCAKLQGQDVVLFKPHFPIETAWAYGKLRSGADRYYEAKLAADERIIEFKNSGEVASLLMNTFEVAVGEKYLAIPTLLEALRAEGVACLMSGSGSCCFALVNGNSTELKTLIEHAWGDSVFWVETSLR